MRGDALEFAAATRRRPLPPPRHPPPEPLDWADDDLETDCWLDVEPEPEE
jgi:hypothetical protein